MSTIKVVSVLLMIVGLLGLVYTQFSYTRETQEAKIGPLELSVKDTETIQIPSWLAIGSLVVGGGLLLYASNKR